MEEYNSTIKEGTKTIQNGIIVGVICLVIATILHELEFNKMTIISPLIFSIVYIFTQLFKIKKLIKIMFFG